MADDFSQRAARGQALNLAVEVAVAEGKQHDTKYITQQFYRFLQFADILQRANIETLIDLVENPRIIELLRQLDKELNNEK